MVNEVRLYTNRRFAKDLKRHQAYSITAMSYKARNDPNFAWKMLKHGKSKSGSDYVLTSDQWCNYFGAELSEADAVLESVYEKKLDKRLLMT